MDRGRPAPALGHQNSECGRGTPAVHKRLSALPDNNPLRFTPYFKYGIVIGPSGSTAIGASLPMRFSSSATR